MSESNSDFWRFSLRFYRRPEVAGLCLVLQDKHGVDVNLLLFVLYLAINGRQITLVDVRRFDASIRDWRTRVVQPLRAIRRDLKNAIAPIDLQNAESLRSAIKRDELQAERLQQAALEQEFPLQTTGSSAASRDAVTANINACGALTGALPGAETRALLTALSEEFSV